jgi:hypothetical protein
LFIPHEPGAPPQRWQGGIDLDDAADSPPTANTLKLRAVRVEPQSGHFSFSSRDDIDRTSFSNFRSQL